MAKFFVIGDVTVDQMVFVDELPEPGGDVLARRAVLNSGGAGGTLAVVLARLGNEVTLATRVGEGVFGELALRHVKQEKNINTSLIQTDDQLSTSMITIIITPDTERTMISYSGASRKLDATALMPEKITACDALVVSAYSLIEGQQREYAVKALDIAKESNLKTFIDMGSGAVAALYNRLSSLVSRVDYMLMNKHELFMLTGKSSISEAVEGLADQGIQRLVIKVGEMGSIIHTPEFTELVEAYPVDSIDTTGAGDYYTAAFAHAMLKGHDLYSSACFGNIAGALNVTYVGAQSCPLDDEKLEEQTQSMLELSQAVS